MTWHDKLDPLKICSQDFQGQFEFQLIISLKCFISGFWKGFILKNIEGDENQMM